MQVNVSQQLKEPIGSTRVHQISGTVEIGGSERSVEGKVTLTRTDRGILVQGTVRTGIEVTCSRCLSKCLCPMALTLEEEYFPTRDVLTGVPLPVSDEAGCFTIDERHILDLSEAVRQYAVTAMPMKPLCRDDCAGLCPTCGHNLNLGSCECPPQKTDPRWSVLHKLAVADSNA